VRALWASTALAALAAAGAGCGGGDDGTASSRAGSTAKPVGEEIAGSVVQYADCADWRAGSRTERMLTVRTLRGQLTPQRSATASSPLRDERAYELLDKSCQPRYAGSLRLYKLYVRMQGFAPLSE
jgi:hypothetical protein